MNYVLTAEPLVLSVQIGAPKMTVSSAQSSMVATIRKLAPFSLFSDRFRHGVFERAGVGERQGNSAVAETALRLAVRLAPLDPCW